jgi:squalene-hopene/tetraprenyl-beta-curcumene cyclase
MLAISNRLRSVAAFIAMVLACRMAFAGDNATGWKPDEAGKYLDGREKAWLAFDSRGEGATRSSCVSCHTVLPYALARPALRKFTGAARSEGETQLLAQTRMRVANWSRLDTKALGLFYNDTDRKKKESWGTEAVLNAVILAFDDQNQGASSPSKETKQAFAHLWATQVRSGENRGSWDWLDFGEPPWGDATSRYWGGALAAIAVGTAPGYYAPKADPDADAGVAMLRNYLKSELPKQNLHNQAWGLWAAAKLDGILAKPEQEKLCGELLARQQADGGWCLPSLGAWRRRDGTPQDTQSDGYATGLILHVLEAAGAPKGDPRLVKGRRWLLAHQSETGDWQATSLIKKRNRASHIGKFMSDAATAFAVLAMTD